MKLPSHGSFPLLAPRPLTLALAAALACTGLAPGYASTVSLGTTDSAGSDNSFDGGAHWADGVGPSSSNSTASTTDYLVSGLTLYANPTTGNTPDTFRGQSLTLNNAGLVTYLWTSPSTQAATLTINSLIIGSSGAYMNHKQSNTLNLAGNMSLLGTFSVYLYNSSGGVNLTAAISGSGKLVAGRSGTGQASNAVMISHANNTYTGGTQIVALSNLDVRADGALGTGDVTMSGGNLTFELGTTNDYIADTAKLKISSGLTASTITLNYTGSDTVAGISLDGGATYLAAGTYTATSLNTAYGSTLFAGAGSLVVAAVPEPGTVALLALGTIVLGFAARRRLGSAAA